MVKTLNWQFLIHDLPQLFLLLRNWFVVISLSA